MKAAVQTITTVLSPRGYLTGLNHRNESTWVEHGRNLAGRSALLALQIRWAKTESREISFSYREQSFKPSLLSVVIILHRSRTHQSFHICLLCWMISCTSPKRKSSIQQEKILMRCFTRLWLPTKKTM